MNSKNKLQIFYNYITSVLAILANMRVYSLMQHNMRQVSVTMKVTDLLIELCRLDMELLEIL